MSPAFQVYISRAAESDIEEAYLFGIGGARPTHRVLFQVQDKTVQILRVIHSAQAL